VRAELEKCGRSEIEIFCASQTEISPQFALDSKRDGAFQPTFENLFFETTSIPPGTSRAA
jgi:hypothetical protein